MLGLNHPSTRVTLQVEDRVGMLEKIAGLIGAAGINIISTNVQRFSDNRVYLILRLGSEDIEVVKNIFESVDMEVVHIC